MLNKSLITITHQKKTLAIIIKANHPHKPHQFLTKKDSPFQLGLLKYPKNYTVAPHKHNKIAKTIRKNQEFILVKSGKLEVTFYSSNNKTLSTHLLEKNDILIQLKGAHSFKFLKPTKTITIKQGPYKGKAKEKTFI